MQDEKKNESNECWICLEKEMIGRVSFLQQEVLRTVGVITKTTKSKKKNYRGRYAEGKEEELVLIGLAGDSSTELNPVGTRFLASQVRCHLHS
jgi:hypothetical protein